MKKHFISANQLLVDSFKLAEKVYLSGFTPDFIIGVWRGGAPVGIAIHEYLELLGINTDHIAIRTSSYSGINQRDDKVDVLGFDYVLDKLDYNHKVLLVDDVFDTGRSIAAILQHWRVSAGNNTPSDIKIACPWFKPHRNLGNRIPDFYLHETDDWLVFPHELKGLTLEEIINEKPDIASSIVPHLKP